MELKSSHTDYILAIESSCDDTSAAVMQGTTLLSNVTASQDVHRIYGGVVPELASRAHQQNIVPVVDHALKKAGINPAHVDSEEHMASNMGKGWITEEQVNQAREIKEKVAAEKMAQLSEQQINQIANGRLNKFFQENTLMEQEYQLSEDKATVAAALKAADAEAKVVAFKRFSLSD